MSLHIEERDNEGIIILDLKGPLTLGHGDLELRDRLPALRQSGKVNIVLNPKDVSDIDSTGLGTLVFGLARRRKAGARRVEGWRW
jgi:anti-anti-sigma factor